MPVFLALVAALFRSFFRAKRALVLENLALRQQLTVYKRAHKRPRLRAADRAFWVSLSRLWNGWQAPLIFVNPETVIRWHRQGFKLYWRRKSKTNRIGGRPKIPREHIDFIRRMSMDNPIWGEDKIFEELNLKLESIMQRARSEAKSEDTCRTDLRGAGQGLARPIEEPEAHVKTTDAGRPTRNGTGLT